jgi:hypothetical protein
MAARPNALRGSGPNRKRALEHIQVFPIPEGIPKSRDSNGEAKTARKKQSSANIVR